MGIVRWKNKLVRFGRLDGADQWLLLCAAGWLLVARIRLASTSFSALSERLSAGGDVATEEADEEVLRRIGFAVRAAAGNVPWRSDCFPQTIAAHELLKRRGYASTVHLGVEPASEDKIAGHAWLTSGGVVVVGGEDLARYTEIHNFHL